MKKVLGLGLVVLTLALSVSMANAAPLEYFNNRPVAIGSPSWDGSAFELANLLPQFNVLSDQQDAGYWTLGGFNPTTVPVVSFEITANSSTLQMGIFSDTNGDSDAAGRTLVDIFLGPAGPSSAALVQFNQIAGTMTISGAAGVVNNGTFSGITPSGFGFYIQPAGDSGSTFYSLDQLNGGLAQMVAFREVNANRWTLGFEDLANTGAPGATDGDFNDFIFQIESIEAVPEPASLVLLGFALIGVGFARRKG